LRLYAFTDNGDRSLPRLGAAVGGPVVDLGKAWTAVMGADPEIPFAALLFSSRTLLGAGPGWWVQMADLAGRAADRPETHVDLDEVRLLAPLFPESLRDFLAFEDHVRRAAARRGEEVPPYWYEAPVYYKGNPRSVIGPDDECPWPAYSSRLDLELELAMVIGRSGRDVSVADAPGHVFGFTIFNDFSARDVQAKESSTWLGPAKSKDFANALGPCIVTADEVGTEPDLEMICRVNGHEWGRARSSEARWSWAEMIAHVSAAEDVRPGDVYGSGTPGGCCGLDLGRELAPGDVVELEVESIGVLRNVIGTPAAPIR
jgi:2-keto-4-pentenoate hydratase/2-oxohepta-3-ene-1,7-dioic acid hydratase in catechol pathway